MSTLGVRASHQAWLRIKRRAAGGAVRGYDAGGAPDADFSAVPIPPVYQPAQGELQHTSEGYPYYQAPPGDDTAQVEQVASRPPRPPTITPNPELEVLRQDQGFKPFNPMQPSGGKTWSSQPSAALGPPTGGGEPPQGLDNLTVNSILHPDTPVQAGRTRTVEDIAAELHARGQGALTQMGVPGGRITEPHPEHDEIISHAMASEAQAALNRPGANAADWYTGKVREAMAVASTMHPEISDDPIAKMAYTAALAITSQGETVPSNVRLTEQAYRYFKENGRFPETVQADSGRIMGNNFAKLNVLMDAKGPQGALDFLNSQMTARELKALGHASASKENMDTTVNGSLMFGPKVGGGFYQNLNGNYDPVTMDLWFMRNWGRLTGTLVGKTDVAPMKDRLVNALQDAGMKVPRTQDGLLDAANSAIAQHEQDFRANRADYDSGAKTKSELTYAAERYQKALQGINETPSSGGQRAWMRDRVNRAREILADQGTHLTNADLQAVLWYPEKDLYSKLGGRGTETTNVDYATALRNVAKANGVPDDVVERAVSAAHQRSRPPGGEPDVAGGAEGVRGEAQGAQAAAPAAGPGTVGGGGLAQAQGAAARLAGARQPLKGLPQGPFTMGGRPYIAGPNAQLHDLAEDYMRGTGREYDPPQTYQKVDKDRAGRIAQAYAEMKHDPNDPAVKASYDAMINETLAQYKSLKDSGIQFEPIKDGQPDPYRETPRLAARDIAENKHLWFFPTTQGFGTISKEELANNPLLRPTGETINGQPLLANDVFRIVHDVFGHLKDGNGFRADGEENAWRSHSAMYSDLARPAMTSETRGQNSWLNYGPHGDKNRTAKSADTIYADQKVGLLPRWAIEEGRGDKPLPGPRAEPHGVSFWSDTGRAVGGRVTPAQAKAGNYRKEHKSVHGIPIAIETSRGQMRRGIGRDGKPWAVKMPADYGYAKGTNGADKDEVDVYLGPHQASRRVFVINQHDADTKKFDEHKVMLCYASKAQALRDYARSFSDGKGKERAHSVIEMSIEDFKERLKDPKAFVKSIKRAAGGRAGFAEGGAPDWAAPPADEAPDWAKTAPPPDDSVWGRIKERFENPPDEPSLIGMAGQAWRGIKGSLEAASAMGEGKVDLSSPEGATKGAQAAAAFAGPLSPFAASPVAGTGRALAREAGFGLPERAIPQAPAAITAEALARQKAADEFNVKLSRGQATGDTGDIRFEDMSSRGAYGDPAQKTAQPFFEQQFQDIGRAGRGIGEGLARDQDVAAVPGEAAQTLNTEVGAVATRAQQLRDQAAALAARDAERTRATVRDNERVIGEAVQGGQPAITGPREAGEIVGQGVRSQAARDRAAYQAQYTAVRQMPGRFEPEAFSGVGSRIQTALTEREEPVMIDDVTTPIASRAIRDVDNISNLRIQNRADMMPNSDAIDLRGVDQARKRLVTFYRAARASGNASDARATGALIDEFDNQVEGVMSDGLFSGDPQALTALQQARAAYSNYARTYRPQQAGDDVGTAMRRIIDRQATPEEIANMITGSGRLGNAGLPVRLADRLEQVLGNGSDAWGAIRQALWQRASQVRNAAGEVDPGRSAQSILDFTGSSLAQRMFSPTERAAMRQHAQGVRNLDQIIEQLPATQAAARAQTMYEQAFGGAGIGGPQQAVFRRMVEGTATPEETVGAVFNSIGGGNPGNTVRLLDAIERITGPQSQAMAAIRQGVWQKLTQNAAGKDQPGQQKLAQAIDEFLSGKGRTIARRLYSDNERFLMKRYADVVRQTVIPKYARTNSDTTPALMSMLNRYGSAIATTIGATVEGVTHGIFGGFLGGITGGVVGDKIAGQMTKFREAGSAKRVSQQFNWLNDQKVLQQTAPRPRPLLTGPQALRPFPALSPPIGPLRQLTGPTPAGAQNDQRQ